jgi:transcriptional regulator with XRE-family HTH domain
MARKIKFSRRHKHFLREWRKFKGLSLEKVTERLRVMSAEREAKAARIGATHGNLSRIERGEVPYSQDMLELLADIYGTDAASLIMRDPTDPDGIWSVWEPLKPAERVQAVEIIKALKRTGTNG